MPEKSPDLATPPRTFWQRKVRDPIVVQITQGITPEKIALTIAVGSAIAMFPALGVTTFLCFIAGITLKLNQPIIQAVNYLCTPIHIPLIYVQVKAGQWLFAEPHRQFKLHELAKLLWEQPKRFFHEFGSTGLHAVIVWAVCAPFWALAAYYILLPLLREIVRVKKAAAAKAAAEALAAAKAAAACAKGPSATTPPIPPEHPIP